MTNDEIERKVATNKAAIVTTALILFSIITGAAIWGIGWQQIVLTYLVLSSVGGVVLLVWYVFFKIFSRKRKVDKDE